MTLEKEVQTLDERLSAAGYKDKAPAAVVEKAEAELSDKRLQFKTVSDSIESMLAQVPTKKNCMPRFLRPLYTRPHATRYECYYIPECMCLPRPSMTLSVCWPDDVGGGGGVAEQVCGRQGGCGGGSTDEGGGSGQEEG